MIKKKLSSFHYKLIVTLAVIGLIGIFTAGVYANSGSSREYHLKAAFLRYVAMFIEWPENADARETINICILGKVPSFKGLNSINGRVVNNHTLLVRPIYSVESAKEQCQILFVAKNNEFELEQVVAQTRGFPLITFGDMEGFAELGGSMNFYVVNNRMAMMINQETVKESKLSIHPRMLRLVTVVPDVDETTAIN